VLIHILRISWKGHGDHMGLFFNSKSTDDGDYDYNRLHRDLVNEYGA